MCFCVKSLLQLKKVMCLPQFFFLHKGIKKADFLLTYLELPSNHVKLLESFDTEFYEDILVSGSLIGYHDRRVFNFGYNFDSITNKLLYPAPVYDNWLYLLAVLLIEKKTPSMTAYT